MNNKSMKIREKIFLLREKGMTFRELGLRFGFSTARARQLYVKFKEEKQLCNRSPFASRLSARSRNALKLYFDNENIIDSPETVAKLGRKMLGRIRNLGVMSVKEISKALYELGYIKNPDSW